MKPRLLIVGYGSIGARHARLADAAGATVACVTRNRDCPFPAEEDLAAALGRFAPTHLLVANETARHRATLDAVAASGWRGPVLMEKPLFGGDDDAPAPAGLDIAAGFNLRMHPLVATLRQRLGGQKLFSASFHVGQYLPDWRPGADYRQSYSASRAGGGGVLRDLSHEIDLAGLFCGPLTQVAALGGKMSDLEIDSDDVYHLLARAERCPVVSIELNYLNRPAQRLLRLNGAGLSAVLDFVAGTLAIGGETIAAAVARDHTYEAQLDAFLSGRLEELCSLSEGRQVDHVIVAAERAAAERRWTEVKPA